jgi:fluoride exporter
MPFQVVAAIAFGGALGAVARYGVVSLVGHWAGTGFPFGTLAVNVAGSFAMGLIVELSALAWSPSPELRAFLTVGFLGAFTTFSAFSLDAALLYERGELALSAVYIMVSVVLSVGAFFAALALLRSLLA